MEKPRPLGPLAFNLQFRSLSRITSALHTCQFSCTVKPWKFQSPALTAQAVLGRGLIGQLGEKKLLRRTLLLERSSFPSLLDRQVLDLERVLKAGRRTGDAFPVLLSSSHLYPFGGPPRTHTSICIPYTTEATQCFKASQKTYRTVNMI